MEISLKRGFLTICIQRKLRIQGQVMRENGLERLMLEGKISGGVLENKGEREKTDLALGSG